MPPKQKTIAQPIDRPLSRAYLREFSGWSTAYPPTLSDPTSLRIMENAWVQRDGSIRQRPGMRYISYGTLPNDTPGAEVIGLGYDKEIVGTHEAFYLNDGTKAYLFAVREAPDAGADIGKVGFRVIVPATQGSLVKELTDPDVGFSVPQGEDALKFEPDCTYVKYLQIDNKIFALSNNSDTMRMFTVGADKTAKRLNMVTGPQWQVADKLTVVHPVTSWITSGATTGLRTNWVSNPSFETTNTWTTSSWCTATRVAIAGPAGAGSYSLRVNSNPQRTNLCQFPKTDGSDLSGWWQSGGSATLVESVDDYAVCILGINEDRAYLGFDYIDGITAGTRYHVSYQSSTANGDVGCQIVFVNSAGTKLTTDYVNLSNANTRVSLTTRAAPAGAIQLRVYPYADRIDNFAITSFSVKNVLVCKYGEATGFFSGNSGTNYFWEGTPHKSRSVYHPPVDIAVYSPMIGANGTSSNIASLYAKAGSTARTTRVYTQFYNSASGLITQTYGTITETTGWTRGSNATTSIPSGSVQYKVAAWFGAVPRGEYHYVDAAMFEQGTSTLGTYFDGATADTPSINYSWASTAHASASMETVHTGPNTQPGGVTKTANTLISSDSSKNIWNFGFFYTFSTEIGETQPSMVTVVKTQRGWSQWRWEIGNAAGEPVSTTPTSDPTMCADQLVANVPATVFNNAVAQGATSLNVYMFTWSDQAPVPTTAIRVGHKDLIEASTVGSDGWIQVTPVVNETGDWISVLPTEAMNKDPLQNTTDPSCAVNGLVASDRIILVNDPVRPATIRWSSNQQGQYTNFSASMGGGYKTLTSGNLMVPSTVRLWQNPQSVDTLTILCVGTDGRSTSYYMAPATVASQTEQTTIMGFEETTATPGTVGTYAAEVFNNALYHPLDDQLMKSTANNYNIAHKTQTEQIRNMWESLVSKRQMITSQHDNRLYFLVNNPEGAMLELGCRGNELWVLDAGADTGTWSRWLIQGHSLRKIELSGQIYMSVVRPDGIFYLDPDLLIDDYVNAGDRQILERTIPWKLETNTQGANKAHDAWAHLQQLTVSLGNFQGRLRYGIRGFDLNGKAFEKAKIVRDDNPPTTLTWDLEDYLQVRRDLKEWFFFTETILDDDGITVIAGTGQINSVAYRYTPSTVNTGYEYGSVETFEYGRDVALVESTTTNGIPVPYIDTRRP